MLYKWCRSIRVGQYLYFKTRLELRQEFGAVVDTAGFHLSLENVSKRVGKRWSVTKDLKNKILKAESIEEVLFQDEDIPITISMLKVSNKELNKIITAPVVADEEVVSEMISKVDKKTCKLLFQIAAEDMRAPIDDNIFNEYIENWARAKCELYIAMGKKFTLSKQVDMDMSEYEMRVLIKSLCQKFPKYSLHLNSFRTSDFISNTISYTSNHHKEFFPALFAKGAKLSKAFSKLFQDEKFDIELSKIMQNKSFKGEIVLSIDPMDFLTMSITKHQWSSCYEIDKGCYKTCAFSIMQDKVSMIGYRSNGKTYDYTYYGKSFSWNSKQSRSVVGVDTNTLRYFIGLGQGSPNALYYDTLSEMCRSICGEIRSKNGKEPFEYDKIRNYDTLCTKKYHHIQHDVYEHVFVPKGTAFGAKIQVGVDRIKNPCNGKNIEKNSTFR